MVYKDKTGYEWGVEIDFAAVLDWKAELKLDLGDAPEALPTLTRALTTDPFIAADLLWVACRAEAKAKNVSREDFLRRLSGDTDRLRALLTEGVTLFFLGQTRGSAILPRLLELMRSGPTSNESATSSPASSDSTSAPAG